MEIDQVGMNIAGTQGSVTYAQTFHNTGSQAQSVQDTQESIEEGSKTQRIQENKEKLNELTRELNKELNTLNINVKFGFNEDIEGLYVTVSEKDTNRIIRKIPSDEAMELMAKMKEIVGTIFSEQA